MKPKNVVFKKKKKKKKNYFGNKNRDLLLFWPFSFLGKLAISIIIIRVYT